MKVTVWPNNFTTKCIPTTKYIPKRNESLSKQNLIQNVFSNIIYNQQVGTSQIPINRLMDKWIVVYLPYWNIIQPQKRSEVMIHATTQVNLGNVMLHERSCYKIQHFMWFHVYEMPRIGKIAKTEFRLMVVRVWWDGRMRNNCLKLWDSLLVWQKCCEISLC